MLCSRALLAIVEMPVLIETNYTISIDGSPGWVVKSDSVKDVAEQRFVKIRPWEPSFCKLVAFAAGVEIGKNVRPSLVNCPGYKALVQ